MHRWSPFSNSHIEIPNAGTSGDCPLAIAAREITPSEGRGAEGVGAELRRFSVSG